MAKIQGVCVSEFVNKADNNNRVKPGEPVALEPDHFARLHRAGCVEHAAPTQVKPGGKKPAAESSEEGNPQDSFPASGEGETGKPGPKAVGGKPGNAGRQRNQSKAA